MTIQRCPAYLGSILGGHSAAFMRVPVFGAGTAPGTGSPPLQALNLLNGPFAMQQAVFFAERILSESGSDQHAQIRQAFRLAFGREPLADELKASAELVQREGLQMLTRALLNANEFIRLN